MGNTILTSLALANSTNNRALIDDARSVQAWHKPRNDISAKCIDFLAGRHRTADEEEAYRRKNKTPVTFNFLKPQERSVVGTFLSGKFDAKWIPWGGKKDDALASGLEALRIWDSKRQDDNALDLSSYGLTWVARTAYQEVSMEYEPGTMPVMGTKELNRFSVYPDPSSKDVIRRRDANFYDIRSWVSADDLCVAFPDRAEWVREKDLTRGGGTLDSQSTYDQYQVSTDRDHENKNYRNGQYLVLERFYRVNRDLLKADQRGPSISPVTGRPLVEKGVKHREELWYAVSVEEFGEDFLFNGRHHCQTIDPRDGKVVWPIIEYCFEAVNGEPHSAVEFQLDPARAVDSLMANILHSAKHASSQALLIDPTAFVSEKEAENAAKYHADADRSFRVKPGKLREATAPIEHSTVTNDTYTGLDYAKRANDEIGTATPSLQGQRQGSESGVLYQQRIEQSQVQLSRSIEFFRRSLETKYLVRYILQRQYYSWEMVVPILEPTEEQRKENVENVVLNQQVPAKDPYGFEIEGEVDILNRVDGTLFDITMAPSTRASSSRLKTSAQLAEITQSPAAANDPVLGGIILEAQIELSDLDPKYKDRIEKRRLEIRQNEEQANAVAQAEVQAQQQKAMSADKMATSQMQMADATTNKLMVDASLGQRKVADLERRTQILAGTAMSSAQVSQGKLQIDAQKAGQESQNAGAQMQMQQMDMQSQIQLKQIEIENERMRQQFERERMAYEMEMKKLDLQMKQIESSSREQESLERSFAPIGAED